MGVDQFVPTRRSARSARGLAGALALTLALAPGLGCSSSSHALRRVWTVALPGDTTWRGIAWSPDGRNLLTTVGNRAMVLDASSGATLTTFTGSFTSEALSANGAFSRDGTTVVMPSNEHGAVLWDTATGAQLATLGDGDSYYAAAFSADGSKIVTAGSGVRVWDAGTRSMLVKIPVTGAPYAAIDPAGTAVAVVQPSQGVSIWDAVTGAELRDLGSGSRSAAAAVFSSDGTLLATTDLPGPIKVWNVATGNLVLEVKGATTIADAFSPDGKLLITASGARQVEVRSTATGTVLASVTVQRAFATGVAVSPDGHRLATVDGGNVAVWDLSGVHA